MCCGIVVCLCATRERMWLAIRWPLWKTSMVPSVKRASTVSRNSQPPASCQHHERDTQGVGRRRKLTLDFLFPIVQHDDKRAVYPASCQAKLECSSLAHHR